MKRYCYLIIIQRSYDFAEPTSSWFPQTNSLWTSRMLWPDQLHSIMRTLIIVVGCYVSLNSAQEFYAVDNSSRSGPWKFTSPGGGTSDYLAANVTGESTENVYVIFNAEVTQNGNYSVRLYTPGCIQSDDCGLRGIVNVTGHYVTSATPDSPTSTQVSQTNNFNKYDEIYQGPVNLSNHDFRPTVTLAAMPGFKGLIVAMEVKFALIGDRSGVPISLSLSILCHWHCHTSTVNAISNSETSITQSGIATGGIDAATKTASVTVIFTAPVNSGGLDNGAKIGLGVGVSLGVLLCAIIAITIYIRLLQIQTARKGKKLPHKALGETNELEPIKLELQGESSYKELPGGPSHTELSGGSSLPHELSALDSCNRP